MRERGEDLSACMGERMSVQVRACVSSCKAPRRTVMDGARVDLERFGPAITRRGDRRLGDEKKPAFILLSLKIKASHPVTTNALSIVSKLTKVYPPPSKLRMSG